MRCEEFLQVLDSLEPQSRVPAGWVEHGASCSSCAFAMRLERTLHSAPVWWTPPSLSAPSRHAILKRVASGVPLRVQVASLLEESAMTALLLAAAGFMTFFAAPKVWAALPEAFRHSLSPFLQPIGVAASNIAAPFGPLVHQGWGIAMLSLTAFAVLFAASLSLRTLAPRTRVF